ADQVVLFPRVDVVRADETQRFAEPIHGLAEFWRHHHAVADALDVRRTLGQPHQLAGAQQRIFAGVELLALGRDRRERGDAVDDLDLVAVGLGEPHPLAAAGLVDRLDAGRAGRPRDTLEVVLARRVIGKADEFRLALFGDVDVVRAIGA